MMSVCKTGMDVVLNSLVTVFILDVDDFLYNHLLANDQKAAYQKLKDKPDYQHVNISCVGRVQWVFTIFQMLSHYASDLCMDMSGINGMTFLKVVFESNTN